MYNKPVKTKKYIFYPQRGTAWHTRCPFHDWQYLSMRVAAKTAYTSLRIILVYECNANVVYFDGVQLFNTYGPWGEACGMSGTLASTLGAIIPSATGAMSTMPRRGCITSIAATIILLGVGLSMRMSIYLLAKTY